MKLLRNFSVSLFLYSICANLLKFRYNPLSIKSGIFQPAEIVNKILVLKDIESEDEMEEFSNIKQPRTFNATDRHRSVSQMP
jgi:hypothetical protein